MIPLLTTGDIGLALIILAIMCSPAIIMTIIGLLVRKKYPTVAKILFILSTVNVLVSCGICGKVLSEPNSIH